MFKPETPAVTHEYTTTYTLQGEPLLLARCEDCEENPKDDLEEA